MTGLLRRSFGYLRCGFDLFVLKSDKPQILGLVTNDTCNLSCVGCRVANVDKQAMRFDDIRAVLERYFDKGVRMVYLTGGEPYLWRDGPRHLPDLVRLAHDMGYLRVHVYTNGTVPLSTAPDFTWISIDGCGKTFEKLRGIPIERVLHNARGFAGRHAIIYTINTVNYREIAKTLAFFHQELAGTRTLFFFHTPYYGIDHLYLSREQREIAIDTLLTCKKQGYRVLNTRTALTAYLNQTHGPPDCNAWIVDRVGDYRCCRVAGDPAICRDCGYSSGYEIAQARRWHPSAIRALLRMH